MHWKIKFTRHPERSEGSLKDSSCPQSLRPSVAGGRRAQNDLIEKDEMMKNFLITALIFGAGTVMGAGICYVAQYVYAIATMDLGPF
ncbi:MAG: hypothetical protein ABH822_01180 [Patescibacteria group bacterium]